MMSPRRASLKRKVPSPWIRRSFPSILQQRRELLLPLIPIADVGGAAAFAYITWSQVREKRRKREAEAVMKIENPAGVAKEKIDGKD